jgi:hypothetical protein
MMTIPATNYKLHAVHVYIATIKSVFLTCIQSAPLPNRNVKSLLQDKTSENETCQSPGLIIVADIPPLSPASSDITNHMDPLHFVLENIRNAQLQYTV